MKIDRRVSGWKSGLGLFAALSAGLWASGSGCGPVEEPVSLTPVFALNPETRELPARTQDDIRRTLETHTGTKSNPRMLGDDEFPAKTLKRGQEVYTTYCYRCHGVEGIGNGPAAENLYPRPRNFQHGVFKFKSTDVGAKALRSDIRRIIVQGATGSSMPSFDILPKEDIDAVTDYVMYLTHRGELERRLVQELKFAEEDGETFDFRDEARIRSEIVEPIVAAWREAEAKVVVPRTSPPRFTAEHVARGKALFAGAGGCKDCHGEDGQGLIAENFSTQQIKRDFWGDPVRPANLTAGMLRGGTQPLDIYRKVYAGIEASNMPAANSELLSNPDSLWDLVAYVMSLQNTRRRGTLPPTAPRFLPTVLPQDVTVASSGAE